MTFSYRPVLAAPGASRLLGSALLARLPQGMSSLTVLLLVHDATGSYAAAGVAVGLNALANAISTPLQGRVVDRIGPWLVLGPAAAAQAVFYTLLGVLGHDHAGAVMLIACSALAGAVQPPVATVVRVTLREMFDDHKVRESAFALEAVLQETIWVSGPLVVTVVITVTSPVLAMYMLGGIVLSGTMMFLLSPLLRRVRTHRDVKVPHVSALRSVDLRWMLVPVALTGFGIGCLDVGIPSQALHLGSRSMSGVLLALWSFGSMIGGLRYGTMKLRSAVGTRYVQLLFANALFLVPYLFGRSIPVCGLCSVLAGLALAPAFSCQYSFAGRVILPGTEHEAFSWITSALVAGAAAGSAISGAMISPIGVKAPFALACCVAVLGALASLRFGGRFPDQVPHADQEQAAELAAA